MNDRKIDLDALEQKEILETAHGSTITCIDTWELRELIRLARIGQTLEREVIEDEGEEF